MKFEFEEFSTIEDVFLYLVSVAPYMKQIMPVSSYKGYVFSIIPLSPLAGDLLMMVYTKGSSGSRYDRIRYSKQKVQVREFLGTSR